MKIKSKISKLHLILSSIVMIPAMFLAITSVNAAGFNQIQTQLDQGESNSDVTDLQTFLAADSTIYPEGLVTGYYGPLTTKAVARFQSKFGISPVGRVGPITIEKINSLISSGTWPTSSVSSLRAPMLYQVNRSINRDSATFTWVTDENSTTKVFYGTEPIRMSEGDINSVGFGSINGQTAVNNTVTTTPSITLNNLQPNTRYYYVLVSTDLDGNVSLWNPNDTFVTGN